MLHGTSSCGRWFLTFSKFRFPLKRHLLWELQQQRVFVLHLGEQYTWRSGLVFSLSPWAHSCCQEPILALAWKCRCWMGVCIWLWSLRAGPARKAKPCPRVPSPHTQSSSSRKLPCTVCTSARLKSQRPRKNWQANFVISLVKNMLSTESNCLKFIYIIPAC